MKIFGISLMTILIVLVAYFAGTKGVIGQAQKAVGL